LCPELGRFSASVDTAAAALGRPSILRTKPGHNSPPRLVSRQLRLLIITLTPAALTPASPRQPVTVSTCAPCPACAAPGTSSSSVNGSADACMSHVCAAKDTRGPLTAKTEHPPSTAGESAATKSFKSVYAFNTTSSRSVTPAASPMPLNSDSVSGHLSASAAR
jgi:hypothetical protein